MAQHPSKKVRQFPRLIDSVIHISDQCPFEANPAMSLFDVLTAGLYQVSKRIFIVDRQHRRAQFIVRGM
jgi:hypothetical protein